MSMRFYAGCFLLVSTINLVLAVVDGRGHSKARHKDFIIIEKDIAVTIEDFKALQSSGYPAAFRENGVEENSLTETNPYEVKVRSRRAVTALPSRKWPNATVPYVIGSNVTAVVRKNIYLAIRHWEMHTCISFVNHTDEADYIEFKPGKCGCCSFVGRKGIGRQIVTLSPHCARYGVVIHELGHVIGFWHEHSRPDRDRYIHIATENIDTLHNENFDKKSILEIDSLGQPYDYYSIMHYRRNTFSKNGRDTLVPIKKGMVIGQREALSPGDIVQARLLYNCPKPTCYEEFTSRDGNFSTPNYPVKYLKDHNCTWIIHNIPGQILTLQFTDFAVETSENCTFDYVEIRQGVDSSGQLIGRLCGEGPVERFQSMESLWIRFRSDNSIAMHGFHAKYQIESDDSVSGSGSGGGQEDGGHAFSGSGNLLPFPTLYKTDCVAYLTDRTGSIASPIVPVGYHSQFDCSWTISGGKGAKRISLKFDISPLAGPRNNCVGDIYFKQMEESSDSQEREMTENKQDTTYGIEKYSKIQHRCRNGKHLVLNTSTALIEWSSAENHHLKLKYVIDYDECRLNMTLCEHVCVNTMMGYYCTCHAGYAPIDGGKTCRLKTVEFKDTCGGNFSGIRGRLRSSTEPIADCVWTIRQPLKYRITLTFSKFDVPSDHNCSLSYVEIEYGEEKDLRGRYCGKELPSAFTTPHGLIVIRLHVDTTRNTSLQLPFFSARYIAHVKEKEKCFHKLRGSGNITSPGHPSRYPRSVMCVWRISARSNQRIRLDFASLDIEKTHFCQFDHIEVRDGRHRTSPLRGRFCGKRLPKSIVSSGKHLWLMFLSDENGSGQGFSLQYTTVSHNGTEKS